jgi:hypothetical protein
MVIKKAERAVKMLYNGKCNVYRISMAEDESGISKGVKEKVYENVMCRISYQSGTSAKETETMTAAEQRIKLFVSAEYIIKSGDVIDVEQNGRKERYKACGRIRLYGSHQEAELEIYDESV